MKVGDIRREYDWGELNREDLDPDPIRQFDRWFEQARDSAIRDPSAMSLATADLEGNVTNRTVLLKIYDQQGFVFFTNTNSTKGRQLRLRGKGETVPLIKLIEMLNNEGFSVLGESI